MLAAQAKDALAPFNPLSWFSRADRNLSVVERAERALLLSGLATSKDKTAAILSHGIQRQLEIAMVLATVPDVLLLDEPLAGMGAAEAETMVALLQALKKDHAMLLVEHDMDAVFVLADVLTVMVNGTVIASGTPEAIRSDAKVQAAYLGEATP
jgi:branched-chain amino acid transport system ATP-binding protein